LVPEPPRTCLREWPSHRRYATPLTLNNHAAACGFAGASGDGRRLQGCVRDRRSRSSRRLLSRVETVNSGRASREVWHRGERRHTPRRSSPGAAAPTSSAVSSWPEGTGSMRASLPCVRRPSSSWLWSRWSRVRVPSLTLKKAPHMGAFCQVARSRRFLVASIWPICPPPARDLALGRDKERLRSHSLWRPSRSHDRMPASPLFKLESRCGWMQPGPAIQRALPGSTRGRPKSRRSQAHNPKVAGSNPAPLPQNPSHSGGCR